MAPLPRTLWLLAVLAGATPMAAGQAAAPDAEAPVAEEICYRDDSGRITTRRRPGYVEVPCPVAGAPTPAPTTAPSPGDAAGQDGGDPAVPGATGEAPAGTDAPELAHVPGPVSPIPRPQLGDYTPAVAMPDRWRLVDALGYRDRWYDPYNRNVLKADKPIHLEGHEAWFFNLGVIADTVYEQRDVPTAVGGASSQDPGSLDVFGAADQGALLTNLAAEFVLYKGDTVFMPPEWEFRFTPAVSFNRVRLEELSGVYPDPREGRIRTDTHLGVQAAFVDRHLRNVSTRYDFDSLRIGIQPFSSDFRGFLFQDNQPGIRLFGNRDNNRRQYNIAYFRLLEKDTNSGLNDIRSLRRNDVLIANHYWQDLPVEGFTSQATIALSHNREDGFHYNTNGFLERPAALGRQTPRSYDVAYVGYNGDGHFGRWNATTSLYGAFGRQPRGNAFVAGSVDIAAVFAALELSMDFDWVRPRLSLLYGSGDGNPHDRKDHGFDAILENPQFAGADTSYWIRQAVPLIGGGGVALSGRNSVLASLRSSRDEGQANFTNPGILLAGLGVDLDVLPTLRVSINANALQFADTAVLELARNQAPISRNIGTDVSLALTWRPLMSQNIVLRSSYARLVSGKGFDALFPGEDPGYLLLNVLLAY